ncbi:hypothetical protein D3C74_397350 [compost metagenome]
MTPPGTVSNGYQCAVKGPVLQRPDLAGAIPRVRGLKMMGSQHNIIIGKHLPNFVERFEYIHLRIQINNMLLRREGFEQIAYQLSPHRRGTLEGVKLKQIAVKIVESYESRDILGCKNPVNVRQWFYRGSFH